jgi:uncharacterized small protein (DUF1192 family)
MRINLTAVPPCSGHFFIANAKDLYQYRNCPNLGLKRNLVHNMTEEELPLMAKAKTIDLEIFSIEELHERVSNLKEEIMRCEAAIIAKNKSRDAAEALFGRQ